MSAKYFTNNFAPGYDASFATSISKEQLIQMVSRATPIGNLSSEGIGGVIAFSSGVLPSVATPTTWPDTGNRPEYARYVWIDTYNLSLGLSPVIRLWKGTYTSAGAPSNNAADWPTVGVADNSITTAMLQALSVTFAKIAAPAGTQGRIVVVDSTTPTPSLTTRTWDSLLNTATDGKIGIDRIDGTDIGDGQVVKYNATTGLLEGLDTTGIVNAGLSSGSLSFNKLTHGTVGTYLIADYDGVGAWQTFPYADWATGAPDNFLYLQKLKATSATPGPVNFDGSSFVVGPVLTTLQVATATFTMAPAGGTYYKGAYTFTGKTIKTLQCFISVGTDAVSLNSSYTSGAEISVTFNGSTVTVISKAATMRVIDSTGSVTTAFAIGTAAIQAVITY